MPGNEALNNGDPDNPQQTTPATGNPAEGATGNPASRATGNPALTPTISATGNPAEGATGNPAPTPTGNPGVQLATGNPANQAAYGDEPEMASPGHGDESIATRPGTPSTGVSVHESTTPQVNGPDGGVALAAQPLLAPADARAFRMCGVRAS